MRRSSGSAAWTCRPCPTRPRWKRSSCPTRKRSPAPCASWPRTDGHHQGRHAAARRVRARGHHRPLAGQAGDQVVEFEPMLEVDTDKVSAEVPAPVTGILKEILAKE